LRNAVQTSFWTIAVLFLENGYRLKGGTLQIFGKQPQGPGSRLVRLALLWQILANGKVIGFANQFLNDS
jgi:hypothetical protein